MLWAFQQLKSMYPNHITCIAHGLYRVCESIRENFNSVNNVIAALKKILVKAPSRQVLYKEVTGLHLPQFPAITTWGTWIRCYKHLPDVIQGLEEEGMEEEEEEEQWKKLMNVGDGLDGFAKDKFELNCKNVKTFCNFY